MLLVKNHSELGEIIDIYRNRGDCIQIAVLNLNNLPSWKQLITYMLLKKKLIYTSLNKKFSLTEPIVCKILNVLVIGKLKT